MWPYQAIKHLCVTSFIIILCLLCLAQPQPIFARNFEVSISPPVSYVSIKPGQRYFHSITLENKSTHTTSFQPTIYTFEPDLETGSPRLTEISTLPFIKLSTPPQLPITLKAGEKKIVTYTIEPPADSPALEYHLTFVFESQNTSLSGAGMSGTTTQVSGGLGSNLVLYIASEYEPVRDLIFDSVSAPTLVDSFQAITFAAKLKNNGPYAVPASGSAQLKGWGQTLATYTFYPDMILSHSTRPLRPLIRDSNPPEVDLNGLRYERPFLIGLYTLEFYPMSQVEPGTLPMTKLTIVAFPFSLVVVIVVGLLIYYLSIWLNRNFFLQKHIKEPNLK